MREESVTSNIMMIRPHNFGFNEQTALTNKFQRRRQENVNLKALKEFNNAVKTLKSKNINVFVFDDLPEKETPDSVFPNNWVSFHSTGEVVIYPMLASNRREERRIDIIQKLSEYYGFSFSRIIDLTKYENEGKFLEGTGSLVLDRKNKIAYSCISERTNPEVLNKFCREMGYRPVAFKASDNDGFPIYHTNVMMAVAEDFAMVCLSSIKDETERDEVISSIENSGKKIIDLSFNQVLNFAGNALELVDKGGAKELVISKRGFNSLSLKQKNMIREYCEIIPIDVSTIEECGGGSIRCMICEIFLPQKKEVKSFAGKMAFVKKGMRKNLKN